MIRDALRYPVSDELGRAALLRCGVSVVALAVGVRYAVAVAPSIVALVPAAVALLGAVVLFGTTAVILGSDDRRPLPSVRAVVRPGLEALALSVVVLVPAIALLTRSLIETPEALASENGAGLGLFSLVSSTIAIFFFAACAYAYPAAVAASVSTGRLRAAVESETVLPALTDPTYFLRWTVGFSFVVFAAWLVVTAVRRGDVVGLLAAGAAAYAVVAGARAVGVGYARVSGGRPR
ncbi:hypothetical protein Htur_1817 [Haloterrigena turkmenica DSM 5511]|uniref:DUF4013 domain-containing protein n=1 Tax=Haloterrigena turkmenica (strain ATCC 51198 / DSM 5511 / JCM 9101 / NCIMB 13204 / VKM B-1734 / 4k) TaxID=543526 RepID=D2RSC1_HALTV|nr:DUF4013 domain-containing protein [Haloterrigena turkmenica]ADB60702.1 hypothetical protein Htur_1817 [Haloterrigena turkmenica DSM 5511]